MVDVAFIQEEKDELLRESKDDDDDDDEDGSSRVLETPCRRAATPGSWLLSARARRPPPSPLRAPPRRPVFRRLEMAPLGEDGEKRAER